MEWLDMDEMWMRAISESVSEFVKEQNKANSELIRSMDSKIDTIQPYRSPMDSMPKPSLLKY